MGLDISVYEVATLTPEHEHNEQCWEQGHVRACLLTPSMARSLRGLEAERCYEVSGYSFSFRAGSYSGYGAFREALCEAAHGIDVREIWADPEPWSNCEFFELLNFSDCDGTIGPDAAADLAKDFTALRERIYPLLDEIDQSRYDDWERATTLAAGAGLIEFH